MRDTKNWLEISIRSNVLFDSSSTRLQDDATLFLSRLGANLAQLPFPILVEGYTDNEPINSRVYPSNWELASGRSATVVKLFIENGVDPSSIASVSFGEFQPIRSNQDKEGRQENRRVNILVIWEPKLMEVFLPRYRNPVIEHVLKRDKRAAKKAKKIAAKAAAARAAKSESVAEKPQPVINNNLIPVLTEEVLPGGGIRIGRELKEKE